MKEFKESIRGLTIQEMEEMHKKLYELREYTYRMGKYVEEIEEKDKKESVTTPEYQAAIERRKTANVKEQYIQIYEYLKSQTKSPWHKYFKRSKGRRALETGIDKLGKILNSRNSFTIEQIDKLIFSELTDEERKVYGDWLHELRGGPNLDDVDELIEPAKVRAYDGSIENKSTLQMAKSVYKQPSMWYSGIGGFYGFSGRVKEKMARFGELVFRNKINKKTTLRAAEALKTVDVIGSSPDYYKEKEQIRLDMQRRQIVGDIVNSIVKKLKEANIVPEYIPSGASSSDAVYSMAHNMQLQINALSNEIQSKIKPEDQKIIEMYHEGEYCVFGDDQKGEER